MNRDNWLPNKPSTKVHHAPGGNSSFSLGWCPQERVPAKPTRSQMPQQQTSRLVQQQGTTRVLSSSSRIQQPGGSVQVPPPKNQCHATAVRQFTRACGQPTPNTPQLMNRAEVEFITKMVLDELLELNATVMSPQEAKQGILNMLKVAKDCPQMRTTNMAEVVAEQADALVDIWYYSLNCAAKKGMNLSSVFDLVHAANMRKVNPATGMCVKRADGKIEKPAGWCPPDITREMHRQANQGSFS